MDFSKVVDGVSFDKENVSSITKYQTKQQAFNQHRSILSGPLKEILQPIHLVNGQVLESHVIDKVAQEKVAQKEAYERAREIRDKEIPRSRVGRIQRKGFRRRSMKNGIAEEDWLTQFVEMPKVAQRIFNMLRLRSGLQNNRGKLPKTKTKSEYVMRQRGLKILYEYNFVRKIKNDVYMISPKILVPSYESQAEALSMWHDLK